MKDREFREVLEKAVRGDKVAMEQIFILYKPMIDHASVVNGKLDEDFRQEIFLHLDSDPQIRKIYGLNGMAPCLP